MSEGGKNQSRTVKNLKLVSETEKNKTNLMFSLHLIVVLILRARIRKHAV